MINIKRQIEYWINNAKIDIETAELLINNGKILHGLFFCHLVIEKALKAIFVKEHEEIPPKSHNLIYLSEKLNLEFDDDTEIFLGILMKYQLEGRYPDFNPTVPLSEKALNYLQQTKTVLEWLEKKL